MYIQFKNDVYDCAPDGTKYIKKKKKRKKKNPATKNVLIINIHNVFTSSHF